MDINTVITAVKVEDDDRLNFLPKFLGQHMIIGEHVVYTWMSQLCTDYHGGFWDFFELSNGGFFMAPSQSAPIEISVTTNFFKGEMSAEAAGIVATLFALCDLVERTEDERICNLYHYLREFIYDHAESAVMTRAID